MRAFRGWSLPAQLSELLRFALVGVLNTVCTVVAIYIAMALGAGVYAANAIGYALGLVVSFNGNDRWTFPGNGTPSPARHVRFVVGIAVAYLANLATVYLCLAQRISPHLAQLVGMPAYTVTFYVLCKFYIFHESVAERRAAR
jgi:putative flippase GtrA